MNARPDAAPWKRTYNFPLVIALLLYGVAALVSYELRTPNYPELWLIALAFSGGAALLFTWRKLDWSGHQFDAFVAIILLTAIANRALYIFDFTIGGVRMYEWPVPSIDPDAAILKGEIVTVIGILFTGWGWYAFNNVVNSNERYASIVLRDSLGSTNGYWALWGLGLTGVVLTRIYAEDAASLGGSLSTALAGGLMSVLTLTYRLSGKRTWRLAAAFLLSTPFIYASLGSGFKESVIFSCLPLAIVVWRHFPSRRARAALLAVAVLGIGTVTSYVQYYRVRVWTLGDANSIVDVTRGFLERETADDGESGGLPRFLTRNNSMYYHGWSIDVRDNGQVTGSEMFAPLGYIFIPRLIWPGKPEINPGSEHSERIWGSQYVLITNSATAAGLYPAFYMGGQYLGVIVGAIGTGVLMAAMYFLLRKYANSFAAGIYAWVLFLTALRLDENWPVYALSAPIINAAYAIMLGTIAGFFSVTKPTYVPPARI